jgi:N-methylhydantoinase A
MLRVGIDIGGTFTDFTAWQAKPDGGEINISFKVPSTPPNFAEGFKNGFMQLLERVGEVDEVFVVHGTTVSTNTVIERSAAPVALFTTAGFKDVLNLQRLRLKQPTDIFNQRPASLVPRHLVFEIDERLWADGSVRVEAKENDILRAVQEAEAAGAEGVAVAFMHSFRNPAHEELARRVIRDNSDLDVSISSEIWPQIGEYERAVLAVLNAYVRPAMNSYIGEIEAWLHERLPNADLFITRSNGGAMAATEARAYPVQTLLSGPASGVTAAQDLAERLGDAQILTFDMGGTSTDVSLIRDASPTISNEAEVGDFPLTMPVTEIEAIGAGGGSLIAMDGKVLKVGPRSAGARPGPACFGHGGTRPAVSDAYAICGYLNPDNFLGGKMKLDVAAAEKAIAAVAEAMKVDAATAAEAAITVATSNMVARVMPYLARHGVDPEDVTLVVYGGAGALHGPLLAQDMGIGRVLVPPTPSVFCASGGLVTGLVHDVVASVHGQSIDVDRLKATIADLVGQAHEWLGKQVDESKITDRRLGYFAEMRYQGQSFQVRVGLDEAMVESGDLGRLTSAFHAEHERLYSHCDPDGAVEILEIRARISGHLAGPSARTIADGEGPASNALAGSRRIRINGGWHEASVYDRQRFGAGHVIDGPAVIEQGDATIIVPPNFKAETNRFGDLIIERL